MTKTLTNKCRKVKHLKMYWLMFSSCSYPGPPGPGPGDSDDSCSIECCSENVVMSQNLDDEEENTSQNSGRSTNNTTNNNNKINYQHLKTINNYNKYNKNSNRRRSLLDSNLLWIFLGFIWLSSPTLVGCRNDEPILVSSCDFNRLERSLASRKTVDDENNNRITNNNNNCTYVKLNYYDYVNDSSSNLINNNNNNNNNNNYSDLLSSTFSSSSSSFSSNSASELYPANTNNNNNNNDDFISDKEKKQSQIDRKIIDEFRLEAIKAQILSKLGLKSKPHVTHTVSRDVVLETIQRAKETYFNYDNNRNNYHRNAYDLYYISGDNSGGNQFYNQNYDNSYANKNNRNGEIDYKMTNDYYERQQYAQYNQKHQQPGYETMYGEQQQQQQQQQQQHFPPDFDKVENEPDDFYAKTSEIISFAGKGKELNGQRLLEFSITTDDRSLHQELRVRVATLWIKVDLRSGISLPHKKFRRLHHDKKSLTLWVFRLVEPYDSYGGGYLNDKDFDRATDLIALQQIKMSQLGWQKIDLTAAISKWYSEGGNRKLRLLIDCSGCGDRIVVHLFNSEQNKNNYNNVKHYNKRKNLNNVKSNHQNNNNNKRKSHESDLHNHYNNNNYHHNGKNQYQSTSPVASSISMSAKNSSRKRSSIPRNHYHTFSQLDSNSSRSNNNSNKKYEPNKSSEQQNRPFLVVHIDPNVIKRVRRRAVECTGALEGQCCKQRFYVSFKEIGWDDWILAPPGYYANYCRGDCSGIFRTPDTYSSYHAHFIEEYRKAEKLEGMQPCCAPTKFSSMSLIYYGPDEKIIKRDLPKMVVDECGCP